MENELPVLLIVYRRVKQSLLVYNALSELKPKTIYIFFDAPKNEEEKPFCEQVKFIFDRIDWTTNVIRNYENRHSGGSTYAVIKALNWFFSIEKKGIILEDDCIPNKAFLNFCNQNFHLVSLENKIFQLSGTNLISNFNTGNQLSAFTIPPWGWATSSCAWSRFSDDFSIWKKNTQCIKTNTKEHDFWLNLFAENEKSKISWDLQWMLSIWINSGLTLIPQFNLIKNVGFDKYATLTGNKSNPAASIKTYDLCDANNVNDKNPEYESIIEHKVIEFINNL